MYKRVYVIESGNYWHISFDPNGGSGAMPERAVEKREGAEFVVPECAFTAPAGKVFAYWYTDAWPSIQWYSSDRLPVDSDITLKAIWYDEITDVYVNIPIPQAGEYANNNLDLFGSGETSKYYIQGGEWCEKDSSGNYIDFDGQQFVLGGTYYVWIYLETEDGYYFATDDEGNSAIEHFYANGREVEVIPESVDCDRGSVEFMFAYTVTASSGEVHVTPYPAGAFAKVANITGDGQYRVDGVIVTVKYNSPCMIGYWNGDEYVRISSTDNHNGTYSFDTSGHDEVILVVTGDSNQSGDLSANDAVRIQLNLKNQVTFTAVQRFASDANHSGDISANDAVKVTFMLKGFQSIVW